MSRAARLRRAVADWRAAPPDPARAAFLARVAQNAEDIAARDDALGPAARTDAVSRMRRLLDRDGAFEALQAALAEALRNGGIGYDDPALLDHLRRTALDELAVEQPRYRHALRLPQDREAASPRRGPR